MASATFAVKGLRELGEAMRTLKAEVALKYAWQATGAAARVVKKRAVKNIETTPSVRTGNLERSVIIKRMPASERGNLTAEHIVTVRGRGKQTRKGNLQAGAPYAHFVEFGTVKMPAEPFLRPAIEGGAQEAAEAMKGPLERGIIKDRT
jgi:HK97 gp10 family phage protein